MSITILIRAARFVFLYRFLFESIFSALASCDTTRIGLLRSWFHIHHPAKVSTPTLRDLQLDQFRLLDCLWGRFRLGYRFFASVAIRLLRSLYGGVASDLAGFFSRIQP